MKNSQGTGWKARQEAANAARDAGHHPVASTDIGQQRAALIRAQQDAARAQMEERERLYRESRTTCPCCSGKGHVVVMDAAVIVEAVDRYKGVGWRPDPLTIGRMMEHAFKTDRAGNRIDAEPADIGPASEPVKAPTPRKPRASAPPPWLEHDADGE